MKVKITWKAFGHLPKKGRYVTSVEIEVPDQIMKRYTEKEFCEEIYKQTNLYSGFLWNEIEPKLNPERTHTALSIGDEVRIGDTVYVCSQIGFTKIISPFTV